MSSRRSAKRRASGSSSSNSANANKKNSILEQIALLRNFCGNARSDYELTDCLRQCGYNVERAAERMLTGQYQAPSSSTTSGAVSSKKPSSKTSTAAAATKATTDSTTAASLRRHEKMVVRTTKPNQRLSLPPARPLSQSSKSNQTATATKNSTKRKTAPPPPVVTSMTSTASSESTTTTSGAGWLLCQRWLSDAVCTSRTGSSCTYQEVFDCHCPQTAGYSMMRFVGRRMQGTLPTAVARFTSPLQRLQLVSVQAQALMACTQVNQGAHVPLQLTVVIVNPAAFFALFDEQDHKKRQDASLFFEQKQQAAESSKTNNKKELTPVQAAFELLQWAEYGEEMPEFVKPDNDDERSSDAAAAAASSGSPSSQDEVEEEDVENEEEEDGSNNMAQEQKELDQSLAQAHWSSSLPHAEPPTGFCNVTLRPYQKQALHWMLQRENQLLGDDDRSNQQLQEQLQLLSELAQPSASSGSRTSSPTNNAGAASTGGTGIVCECGPVQVSTEQQQQALGGTLPPTHPLWKRRFLASWPSMDTAQPFYVNELLGVAASEPPAPPQPCSGGCLADAMGLGKTVMLLALILKSKELAAKSASDGTAPKTTLVIAKLSLLPQWEEELRTKTNLTFATFHSGAEKSCKNYTAHDLQKYDVVVTTYNTVHSDWKQSSMLQKCNWLRIICDEAHCIRNVRTMASRACCQLTAKHRWVVSGTIVQNSLEDVYGLMKFLRHEPWCLSTFWKAAITKPMNSAAPVASSGTTSNNGGDDDDTGNDSDGEARRESTRVALDRVRRLLMPIMLRRTKDSLTEDGKPILTLPEKEIKTIPVALDETEREFYNALLARSQHIFDGFIEDGKAQKSYLQILALLSKLRQVCDHIGLTVQSRFDGRGRGTASDIDEMETEDSPKKRSASSNEENTPSPIGQDFLEGLLDKFCSKQQSPKKKRRAGGDDDDDDEDSPSKRPKQDPAYVSQVANMIASLVKENATHLNEECSICLEAPRVEDAVITNPCCHVFCKSCLVNYMRKAATTKQEPGVAKKPMTLAQCISCPDGKCPNCNELVEAKRIIALARSSSDNAGAVTTQFLFDTNRTKGGPKLMDVAVKQEVRETLELNRQAVARQILENAVRGTESSKMKAILSELNNTWRQDPGSKVLVFSHYLGFLDLLQMAFRKEGIPYFRLDGSLTLRERMKVLEQFRSNAARPVDDKGDDDSRVQKGAVLLMSTAAGAEGLNLVSASSCFICDPWWNGAREDQCVNRIHRIGQTAKTVRVRKFVVQDSVEERIVELQNRKQYVAGEIYNDENKTGVMENGGRLSLDEFRMMFS